MGNYEIREPVQKRSIEKKDKIIENGFNLICEKGYYNITTADIAKKAGVSVGILYQYFKDKHDILIAGISKYADKMFFPMLSLPENIKIDNSNFKDELKKMINKFIKEHKISYNAHQEIMSMYYTDSEINKIFNEKEIEMTAKVTNILLNNNFSSENIEEKVHLSINMIDDLCHEIVFHKHKNLNYEKMTELVVDTIYDNLR